MAKLRDDVTIAFNGEYIRVSQGTSYVRIRTDTGTFYDSNLEPDTPLKDYLMKHAHAHWADLPAPPAPKKTSAKVDAQPAEQAAPKPQLIVIVDDRFLLSAGRDVVSLAVWLALVGIGVWTGSGAMQWAGAFVAFAICWVRATGVTKSNLMTIEQARVRLDQLEQKQ